jgi:hypothetical protein
VQLALLFVETMLAHDACSAAGSDRQHAASELHAEAVDAFELLHPEADRSATAATAATAAATALLTTPPSTRSLGAPPAPPRAARSPRGTASS